MPGQHNNIKLTLWIDPGTYDTLRQILENESRDNMSGLVRELINKGLVTGGYLPGGTDTAALVRETLEAVLKPHVDRLAAISAKGAQVAAASFFMAAHSGGLMVPEDLKGEYDAVIALARKLGIAFVKLPRGSSLDKFLADGVAKMGDAD